MGSYAATTLLFAAALLHLSSAHVRLTFPPARTPNYDFLDNVRTGGPCGVPDAGESDPVTTLVVGSSLNVSYHLAYPHRGGIRINILDSNGTIVHALLGLDSWRLEDDSTAFRQEVTLPDGFVCDRCVLQLMRQAAEWSATGGYIFWSCADISIQNSMIL
ncbi:hypothetical protein GBAR_LOCUS21685 [Geodia barretti]|uniref:Chitin-binding type-4 domain-containing protein n=1 Tax=Geodia barretti TaxID=519541 RepID=A0AA35WYT8_GEOBA|nr:hypothetical protein GBAR_LOCUS21685 [Geodia barretti]